MPAPHCSRFYRPSSCMFQCCLMLLLLLLLLLLASYFVSSTCLSAGSSGLGQVPQKRTFGNRLVQVSCHPATVWGHWWQLKAPMPNGEDHPCGLLLYMFVGLYAIVCSSCCLLFTCKCIWLRKQKEEILAFSFHNPSFVPAVSFILDVHQYDKAG